MSEWTEQYAALPAAPGMDLGVWGANDIAHRSFEKALDPLVRSQPLLRGAGAAFANRQAKKAAAGAPSRAPPSPAACHRSLT